jgi:hypothetical protein
MAKNSSNKSKEAIQTNDDNSLAPILFTGFLILLPVLYLLFKKKPVIRTESDKKSKTEAKKQTPEVSAKPSAEEIKAKNEISNSEIKKLLKQ